MNHQENGDRTSKCTEQTDDARLLCYGIQTKMPSLKLVRQQNMVIQTYPVITGSPAATSLSSPLRLRTRGLHGSDIHMDIHMVMDKCWIWIGFYRIDGYGYG